MTAADTQTRRGSLVVVGTGIRAIGQVSLEAQAEIRYADRAYFCVAEPATELWILEQRPDAIDLSDFYAEGKSRTDTYVQMAERPLADVRSGLRVVVIFYGHPGFFVASTHRAIAIARQEGHDARMLPAVSSQDCLFADLGVDPAKPASQTLEATDMLLRHRMILVDAHVVILQVGIVGLVSISSSEEKKHQRFNVLLDYLEQFYDPQFEFINYVAAQYAVTDSVIDRVTIEALRRPESAKRVGPMSTFYFPPAELRRPDGEMAGRLGLRLLTQEPTPLGPFWSGAAYGPSELRAVKALEHHVAPANHRSPCPPRPTYELIRDLALDPALLDRFRQGASERTVDVPQSDLDAIRSRRPGRIRKVLLGR